MVDRKGIARSKYLRTVAAPVEMGVLLEGTSQRLLEYLRKTRASCVDLDQNELINERFVLSILMEYSVIRLKHKPKAMKLLIVIVFVFSTAIRCYAQENPDKLQYLHQVEKYRKMKKAGTILTVIGGIVVAVGVISYSFETSGGSNNCVWGCPTVPKPNTDTQENIIKVGMIPLLPGILLTIVGTHNYRIYTKKLDGVSVRLGLNRHRPGLSLTCRF